MEDLPRGEIRLTSDRRMPLCAMAARRTFTAADIIELVEILRSSGDIAPAELAGMELLGRLLGHLEMLSDTDIAEEVRRYFRTV